jgi:hypothetical protein
MKPFIKATPICFLILLLLTAGCQTSTLVSTLEAIVSAAEVALPVIGAAVGLPPALLAPIVGYLEAVNVAAAEAATILASTETSAQKAVDIAKAFAGVAAGCNCIPPGTPAEIVSVINAVANAIGNFLANFQHPPSPAPAIKISSADRAALSSIRTRALANLDKVKGLRKTSDIRGLGLPTVADSPFFPPDPSCGAGTGTDGNCMPCAPGVDCGATQRGYESNVSARPSMIKRAVTTAQYQKSGTQTPIMATSIMPSSLRDCRPSFNRAKALKEELNP